MVLLPGLGTADRSALIRLQKDTLMKRGRGMLMSAELDTSELALPVKDDEI